MLARRALHSQRRRRAARQSETSTQRCPRRLARAGHTSVTSARPIRTALTSKGACSASSAGTSRAPGQRHFQLLQRPSTLLARWGAGQDEAELGHCRSGSAPKVHHRAWRV
eukprot:3129653-Prymnesium_polylepis.1